MGSGGGGSWRDQSGIAVDELITHSQSKTDEAAYNSSLDSMFSDALSDFNSRDVEGINKHLETIENALEKETDGVIRLFFGGSVSKHTYINGLSDVDMLVCLNDSSLESKSPSDALNAFSDLIKNRLPFTKINVGDLAVTVSFSDGHEIQLLPAIKTKTGYKIATENGTQWSNVVNPSKFSRALTDVNKKQGGKVVPLIKIAKAMNENLPKNNRLSGYHIESLAVEIFNNYSGRQTISTMIHHFWKTAESSVLRPIVDSTGQSSYADNYLGVANSEERGRIKTSIGKLNKRIEMADNLRSVDKWKEMFEL